MNLLVSMLVACAPETSDARIRPPERDETTARDTGSDDTSGDTAPETEVERSVYTLECERPEGYDPSTDTLPRIVHVVPTGVRPGEDLPHITIWSRVSAEHRDDEDVARDGDRSELADWTLGAGASFKDNGDLLIRCDVEEYSWSLARYGYPYDLFIVTVER